MRWPLPRISVFVVLLGGCVDDKPAAAPPPPPVPVTQPPAARARPQQPRIGSQRLYRKGSPVGPIKVSVSPRHTGDPRADRLIKRYLDTAVADQPRLNQLIGGATHKYALKTWFNVHYTTHNGHKATMDIFVPQGTKKPPTMVVYFPGGGFVMYLLGFPSGGLISGQYGHAVAFVYYHLSTTSSGTHPAGTRSWPYALMEAKDALRYLRKNQTKYGYDASKIVVGGFSAGGYIAGYLGATSGKNLLQPGPVNDPATAVHGVMMASAISDMALFDPNDPNVQQMRNTWGTLYWALTYYMGVFADSPGIPRKRQKEASALHNIDSSPGNPAKKIIWAISHGDKDTTVPYAQATALRDRLLSVGAQVRLNTFKNEGHNLVTINLKHLDLLVKLVKASP